MRNVEGGQYFLNLRWLIFLLAASWLVSCQSSDQPGTAVTPTISPPQQTTPETPLPQPTRTMLSGEDIFNPPTFTPTAAPPTPLPSPTATSTPIPTPVATIEVVGAILPPGFSMIKYADMVRPTSLTVDAEGRLYATSQDGTIHVFVDVDGDGRADQDHLFSSGFNIPLGITFRPGTQDVYVSSNTKISILRDVDGDLSADEAVNFTRGLPVGRHQNDNLKFGPDGLLYIGVGSTCDACYEVDPRSATIMRFDPETGEGEIFATGLRNPYDLAFHPITGGIFATDNGRDDLGLGTPGEELNFIVEGGDYGFPDCWDEMIGPGCDGTTTAVAFFEAHASANSLDFYTGDKFPFTYLPDEQGVSLFVGIFGSWLKPEVETGIQHVRVTLEGSRYHTQTSWFAQWPGGMPLGLIVGPDGAIYVGDYINDVIYRISYWE